jgi:uncharacterized lipoprotein YajG
MKKLLIIAALLMLAGCQKKSDLYVQAIDPNALIIRYMLPPNENWIQALGTVNERQILFFNLSVAKVEIARLTKRVEQLEVLLSEPNSN